MVEPEVAYAGYEDMMDLGEGLILSIVERVLNDRQEELKTLERDTTVLEAINSPFPRLHYDDAVKMLQEGHAKGELENNFEWGGDFGAPDETYLSNAARQAGLCASLPCRDQRILFRGRQRPPRSAPSASTCSLPKATARSSAAANVPRILEYLSSS